MTTWLLITYLASGGIGKVTNVPSPLACLLRSHFELRHDPRVVNVHCLPLPASKRIAA
jgi:hypothetical protein